MRKFATAGLITGLILGVGCAVFVGSAMLDNNNQGEFADTITGDWTLHFWQLMALIVAAIVIPITGFAALMGLAARFEKSIERPDHQA